MKTHRIKRSILSGALALAVLGSQSMEILTASAASEELEYEGTTQVSSTDYYPAFDTTSTTLTVEEVYVEAGSYVQEGDAILKLTEDSYQSALDYYQAAIIRATNDLTNEELAYAQGMQSAEYELELALASEEQAEFVQEQSEAELSDTIEEHEEVMTEMEERIEALENGEYDSEDEAEEGMSASGMSGTDASGSGMSGGSASGSGMSGSDSDFLDDTDDKSLTEKGEELKENQNFEEQIESLESEAKILKDSLKNYKETFEAYPEAESELEKELNDATNNDYEGTLSEIQSKAYGYSLILSDIYDLLNLLEEADLEKTLSLYTQSALEPAEETYQEPEVIEEPQVEEPQIEEPQAEEPQIEEPQAEQPQMEEPQAEEPAEISVEDEVPDNSGESDGSEDSEANEEEDQTEETETEEWDGMFDPEHPERGGLLTVQIPGGTITLEIPENALTEAVSLQVSELTVSYEALISGAVDAEDTSLLYAVLDKVYESREGTWEDTNDQIYDFYVLDLSFINQDGAVVEPAAAIQVTVDHSADPVNVGASEADMEGTTEDLYRISPASGAAETVGSHIVINNGISSLSFTSDSFSSPFVVLMIEAAEEEETERESEFETASETETDPETQSESEDEEVSEGINTLHVDPKNKKADEAELYDVLGELYQELEEDGENTEDLIEMGKLRKELDTEGVSVGLLVNLDSLLNSIKAKSNEGESLDKAMELLNKLEREELEEQIEDLIVQLIDQLQTEGYKPEELSDLLSTSESFYKYYEYYADTIQNLGNAKNDFIELSESIIYLIEDLEGLINDMKQQIEELEKDASAGSALAGEEQEEAMEAAESTAAGLSGIDSSALAGLSSMSGLDASSMANMSDTEALQLAEEELAAGLGETTVSREATLEVQSILVAQESESMFGDKYDLTEAKALLERKATDADEAEELLDDLYSMQESVQLDYEELLRLRKPLKLDIQYQYDETLLLARQAEITYNQTTKELEEELKEAMENLSDLEEEYQELEDLEDGTVRAAASGTLSAVYYEADDTLFSVYPMYSIYDTDVLTVLIAVPQSEIAQISVGEEVEVSLNSFGTTQGTVAEKAVEAQEGNSRTTVNYEVEIAIDNSSGRLSSGTAVTVTVTEA